MPEVSLKLPHYGIAPIPELPTAAALQPFREVTVTSVGHSTKLATTATGGVLPRTIQHSPGTGPCTTVSAMQTDTTSIRQAGFLFVALGIEFI